MTITIRKPSLTQQQRRALLVGLLFISPAIIGFFVFNIGPIVQSLQYSFTRYNILQPPRWVGLNNYKFLIESDRVFRIGISNTLYMVLIGLPIHLVFNMLMALLLNTKYQRGCRFIAAFSISRQSRRWSRLPSSGFGSSTGNSAS